MVHQMSFVRDGEILKFTIASRHSTVHAHLSLGPGPLPPALEVPERGSSRAASTGPWITPPQPAIGGKGRTVHHHASVGEVDARRSPDLRHDSN